MKQQTQAFLNAIKERRSIYQIGKQDLLSHEELTNIISDAVLHAPSAFNSQSARVVVLLEKQHDQFWNITKEALRKVVPAEHFATTEAKINGFGAGLGTILFYEDNAVVQNLENAFPTYAHNFAPWSLQSSGMLQYIIWTALHQEGYGASLQHYNELIDSEIKKQWNLPQEWKLIAQMPFGNRLTEAGEKKFDDLEKRLSILN